MEADRYRVVWTPAAQQRLREIIEEILAATPSRAIPFGRELERTVATLSWSPQRCSVTREEPSYRQLIVKKYRIIFHIIPPEVIIDTIVYPYQIFDPGQVK